MPIAQYRWSRWAVALLAATAGALGATSCKHKGPTCNPDEHGFAAFRLVVQPELMNLDDDGNPRATVLRIYQLQGGRTLDAMDFDAVFETPAEFFGDELLAEKELPVYPERPEVIEIPANPDATHVVVVALFREPTGNTWYREWEVPRFHGHSVCNAQRQGSTWGDPCFYLTLEGTELDGGHEPPPAYSADKFEGLVCPGKPLLVAPPPPAGKKKRKKRDVKGDAADAKDGADQAQGGADQAGEASEAGQKVGGGERP